MGSLHFANNVTSMAHRFSRWKPGVNRKTLLFWSALLWSGIGLMLVFKGAVLLIGIDERLALKGSTIALGVAAGSLKSFIILDKSARRGIHRILQFQDGTCLGAVYSTKTWLLVFAMMGFGIFLRNSSISAIVLCFIYFAIGWALLFSSRLAWRKWFSGI